jgi:hypothetical protein
MSNAAMDIDDNTDGTDPDAASGSMMVTGAGKVVVTRKPVVYALDKTMVGFKELRQFVESTFFRKLKQFNANVKCAILIQGVQSGKNGISKMCKISIGNTPYAQAKADEYMSNFGIAEVRDDSDTRIVKSAILEMPQMYASEPFNVGCASAADIAKVLWHKGFDNVKTCDGKKYGRDCKQIWDIARDNPHMMLPWWDEVAIAKYGPGHDIAFTSDNTKILRDVIIAKKGKEAYDIKMQQYNDAIQTVNVRADHTQNQSTAAPMSFQIGGKVLKSHGFAIVTIFEPDPDDSSGIADLLMRILEAFSPSREEMMAKWCDRAARWWVLKGGAGKSTFAPGAGVTVGGEMLRCGYHLRALKKLKGDALVAADAAIKARLAELRAAGPSGHDAPWPGLGMLQVNV